MYPHSKPEIMSPAGYWPQLRAAIEAGADSVYFGLHHFTARAKVGFSLEELPEVMRTLHRRGVRGFVTFNTLVFDHEIEAAARAIAAIAEAGADAIIVQDLGMVKLARQIAPDLEIHGSTQMSVTSAEGVRLAQSLGARRVTLARELSLDEIRAIRAATDCELEIFVHGALCVAYSGQCLSSEAWGGRSANRGQCAQACRLPYELMVDGARQPLGDARYLLSPGDLYGAAADSGDCGDRDRGAQDRGPLQGRRLRGADHARLPAGGGRSLPSRAVRERYGLAESAAERTRSASSPTAELQLEQVYSRGLGPHFLTGTNHQAVVHGRAPRHRGVLMGRVARVAESGVSIEPAEAHALAPLKPGDGVVFDAADWRSPEEPEEGGRIFAVAERGGNVQLQLRQRRGGWPPHPPRRPGVAHPRSGDRPPGAALPGRRIAAAQTAGARARPARARGSRSRRSGAWAKRGWWCARRSRWARRGIARSTRRCCARNWGGWGTRHTSWRNWNWRRRARPSRRHPC